MLGSVFISETFQNRFIDNGLNQIHDTNNQGFFDDHFPISEIVEIPPSTREALESKTGITWREVSFIGDVIDFTRYDPEPKNKVVYMYESISVDRDSTLFLRFGSDDGIRIWLNRNLTFSLLKQRGLKYNDNAIKVELKKGMNTLLYKVEQGDGGWSLQRNFASAEELQTQINGEVAQLYNDVLQSHWLGKEDSLVIELHQKTQFDHVHQVTWRWSHPNEQKSTANTIEINTPSAKVPLPVFWNSRSILWGKLTVLKDHEVVFHEWYPVIDSSSVNGLITKISNGLKGRSDKLNESDISTVFERDLHPERRYGWNYSTRYKSWVIAQELGLPKDVYGPLVGNYISPSDSSRQLYRWFSVASGSRKQEMVFVLHGEYEQDGELWGSYEGVSHSLLAKRNALASRNNISVFMPHGRGILNFSGPAKEEINVLKNIHGTDSSELILMSWSRASFPLFDYAHDPSLHISTLILISPIVHQTEIEVWKTISMIKSVYPNMKWIVFHGLNDAEVPIIRTRQFVQLLRENFDSVRYEEVPYASHWNYPIDVEQTAVEWAL